MKHKHKKKDGSFCEKSINSERCVETSGWKNLPIRGDAINYTILEGSSESSGRSLYPECFTSDLESSSTLKRYKLEVGRQRMTRGSVKEDGPPPPQLGPTGKNQSGLGPSQKIGKSTLTFK